MTPQQLAADYVARFETRTRDNGDEYLCFAELGSGEIGGHFRNLIRKAHGDLFPNDTIYKLVHDALEYIADADTGMAWTPESTDHEFADQAVPIYTHELTKWLHEFPGALGYCDEATAEFGLEREADTLQNIRVGYYELASEIYQSVATSLIEQAQVAA